MAAEKNTPEIQTQTQGPAESQGQKVLGTSIEAQGALGETALQIGQPGANIAEVIGMKSGETYVLNFSKGSVIGVSTKGGDLVVEFSNGASVVLKGYQNASDVTLQMAGGQTVSPEQLLSYHTADNAPSQDQLQAPAGESAQAEQQQTENLLEEQLVQNNIEQLTEMDNPLEVIQKQIAENEAELAMERAAEQLAQVEPAAGDSPASPGGNQNNGFGFGSSFESQGVIALADVGPIDPTLLEYGLPEFADDVRPNYGLAPIRPSITPQDPETEQALVGDYKVYEDGSIQLLVEALPDLDGSILTVIIRGIPPEWMFDPGEGTYDPATRIWKIVTGPGETFYGGPIVKPPKDSDVDLNNLVFQVIEFNPGTGQTGTATKIVDVIVDAVADEPEVDAPDNSGLEGTHLDVIITGKAGDTDGSETIVKYQISGVPNGFTFNKGKEVSPGVWEFTPDEINGLKAIPPSADYHGSIDLNVTIFTSETPVTDRDFDDTNDDATATDPFKLTWTPVIDPPEVCVDLPADPDSGVKNAQVYEDNSIGVRVIATLAPGGDPDEILTVKVTGIDLTKLDNLNLEGEAGAVWVRVPGSPDNNASFTITLPANTGYSGLFTFTPKAQSDLDLTNIKVTATAFNPSQNKSADSNEDSFNVIVDAVADKPSITAADATGDEGKPIALDITGKLGVDDFDGSESITGYQIKGNLTGFTFTDANGTPVGTKVSDMLWTFTPDQIAGLKIVPPSAEYAGALNLTAVILTKDTANDIDFNTENNTESAEDPFTIVWDQDDQPIVTNATETVDESFLEIVETGSVGVDYGADGPGKVTINGEFEAGGSLLDDKLTSGGALVEIAQAAVPGYMLYEGFAGGAKVFSLKVYENGNYEYRQFLPLDHANGSDPNDVITLTFGVTATDADGDPTKGTITINVKDDAPTANNDKFCVEGPDDQPDAINDNGGTITAKGTVKTGNVMDNDYKGNDLPTLVTKIGTTGVGVNGTTVYGQFGTLFIKQDGSYTYTSTKHGVGTETFTYTITDKDGDSDSATLTFTLNCPPPQDDQPVAVNDDGGKITTVGTVKTGNVTANDDKGDDLPTLVTHVNGQSVGPNGLTIHGQFGTLFIKQDGSYTYTSTKHGVGMEQFTYTLTDRDGDSDTAILKFTLDCVAPEPDDKPIARDDKIVGLNFSRFTHKAVGEYIKGDLFKGKITDHNSLWAKHLDGSKTGTPDYLSTDGGNRVSQIEYNGKTYTIAPGGSVTIKTNANGKYYGDITFYSNGTYKLVEGGAKMTKGEKSFSDKFLYTLVDKDGDSSKAYLHFQNTVVRSPLVIDMDGDGVELVSAQNGVSFDIDNDGTEEQIGWATGGDGLLAIDRNGNGIIDDQSELFGDSEEFANGFENLASYDSNNDGVIDASDSVFASLRVWIDANHDGNTDAGELKTMQEAGIVSINLNAHEADAINNNNFISHASTVTFQNGETRAIEDVWFETLEPGQETVEDPAKTLSNRKVAGNVLANDTIGNDEGASVIAVKFGGQTYQIPPGGQISINGAHGYLTISSTGAFVFTAFAGETVQAEDIFTYTMRDFDGDTSQATLTLCVKPDTTDPVDDQPDAVDDNGGLITTVGTVKTGNVMANDDKGNDLPTIVTHVNGQSVGPNGLTIHGTYGTLVIQQDGSYTYTSTRHGMGQEKFTYTITDVDGDSDSAVLSFTLNCPQPVDDQPDAVDDNGGTVANVNDTKTGNVMDNDDKGNDLPTIVTHIGTNTVGPNGLTINGLYGTLVIKQDGSYTYTRTSHEWGVEKFPYTITDVDGDSDTAILCFTIPPCAPPDDKPIVANAVETVDETFLNINEPGKVSVNYGNDQHDRIVGDNRFESSGSRKGGVLKSNNVNVDVTYDNGVYTGKAGTVTVFTLTIEQDGSYLYKQFKPLDHADGGNPNDIITLHFGVTAFDKDGDDGQGWIIVNVKDDAPVAVDDGIYTLNSGQSLTGNVTANDTLSKDVTNKITAVFEGDAGHIMPESGVLTINGLYGTLVIHANGAYTYTAKPGNIDGVDTFTYMLKDGDGDTSSATLKFDINPAPCGCSDKPIVAGAVETVDETFLNINEPGQVSVNYGNDQHDRIVGDDRFNSSGSRKGGVLKSNNVNVEVTYADGVYTGKAGTVTVFILTIEQDGSYLYKQFKPLDHANGADPNDIITLNFGVTAFDKDGDKGQGWVTVHVKDDAPLAVNDNGGSVTALNQTKTGNVLTNDTKGNDTPASVIKIGNATVGTDGLTITGTYGTLTINQDGSYTYKATKHGVGTETFTYTMQDFDGDTSTAKLTFDLDCPKPNSNPVITNAVETVDETGLIITEPGTLNVNYGGDAPGSVTGNNVFSSSGSRVANTLTSNGVAVVVTYADGVYTGKAGTATVFTLTINANGSYEYKQHKPLDHANPTDPNDIITLNFGVKATDADGDTGTGSIIVHVKDDAPVARDDAGGSFTALNQVKTGNVLTNDTKSKDSPTLVYKVNGKAVSNAGTVIEGKYGKLTIHTDGSYTYKVTKYGTGMETFTYIIDDFDKDQSSAKLTFDVKNPAPPIILNDNFATIWGNFSYIQYSIFANDGPNGNGTNLPAGQRIASVVYNGTTHAVPNGGSKIIAIPNGSVQFWSNGTVKFSKTNPNAPTRVDDFTVNVTDNAGNKASQKFSTSQLLDSSPANKTAEVLGSSAQDVIFGSSEGSDTIRGGANHDYIFGDNSDSTSGYGDTLYGDAGDDFIVGYYGNDVLYGGDGNDILFGDAFDTIPLDRTIYQGHGNVMANSGPASTGNYSGNDTLYGGNGDDYIFGGNGNDALYGEAGNDYLRGGNGNDTLDGGAGNDILDGMAGNDVLYGGGGADLFLVTAIGNGVDTIKDFNIAEGDQLGLSDILSGYNPLQHALDDFVFARTSGNNTIISVNVAGNGNAAQAVDVFILENRTLTIQDLENKNGIVA